MLLYGITHISDKLSELVGGGSVMYGAYLVLFKLKISVECALRPIQTSIWDVCGRVYLSLAFSLELTPYQTRPDRTNLTRPYPAS